jgi:flagellin-like hook-associated protein FlgL
MADWIGYKHGKGIVPLCRTGENPVCPRTFNHFMGHTMSPPPTTTSAMTALAVPPTEQDLNQVEYQVSARLANMLTDVETAIGSIITAASALRATTANLTTQRTYVSNRSDSLTTGVASLVDANMNEAATKIAAVQVQQPLGEQALSISNSNTRVILKLFEL